MSPARTGSKPRPAVTRVFADPRNSPWHLIEPQAVPAALPDASEPRPPAGDAAKSPCHGPVASALPAGPRAAGKAKSQQFLRGSRVR